MPRMAAKLREFGKTRLRRGPLVPFESIRVDRMLKVFWFRTAPGWILSVPLYSWLYIHFRRGFQMTDITGTQHRALLQKIARRAMLERGLLPDFSPQALAELNAIHEPAQRAVGSLLDLRHLLWCSIDNDDSRDLDQLTVAEALPDGGVKVLVAVADVDALVKKDSAIDQHAHQNTTSVYTDAQIFPMLPEKLSTDLTSLNHSADRNA